MVYVNQVGGNDELIFDGRSSGLDQAGEAMRCCRDFRKRWSRWTWPWPATRPNLPPGGDRHGAQALVLGLRDYLGKCGFKQAVMGLSGGVDSAVTCCLAAAALGRENVLGVLMPSPYTSRDSIDDSLAGPQPGD